jgi:hypothetical protein
MASPYGIEQVDVPGVLGAVQQMQGNRIRMMMQQKQLEMMERQANIQAGTMKALQAYAQTAAGGPPDGDTGSSGASATPSAPTGGAPTGSGMPNAATAAMPDADPLAPLPSAAPSAAPATPAAVPAPPSYIPSDRELAARKQVITSLSVLSPEMGTQLADTFTKMDANQVAAVTQRHTRMAQIAAGILQLPQAQRQQAIQQAAPELQQMGLSPQQIAGFQPTDGNLRQLVAEGMDIERVAQFSRPDVQSIREGGAAVSANPDGTSTTLYESPVIHGPNGEVFQRPGALSSAPHPITATGKNGQKVQFNPQTKQWEPMGGQTPPASGTFPVNNPGALRVPGSTQFQSFATPQQGIQAQEAQLGRYMARGLNSVSSIVETYAPRQSRGGDNSDASVNNYIGYVAKRIGVNPNAPIPPAMLPKLAEAMREFETGQKVE